MVTALSTGGDISSWHCGVTALRRRFVPLRALSTRPRLDEGCDDFPLFPPSALGPVGHLVPKSFPLSVYRTSYLHPLLGALWRPALEWAQSWPRPKDASCGHAWSVCGCEPGSGFRCARMTGLLHFCYYHEQNGLPVAAGPQRCPCWYPWMRKKSQCFLLRVTEILGDCLLCSIIVAIAD